MDRRNAEEEGLVPEIPGSLIDDGVNGPRLAGSRCERCGEIYFPSRRNCPQCMSESSMRVVALSSRGRLDGFVVATVAPPGFEVPHAQGFVRLHDEGIRIFSLLTGHEGGKGLEAGCEMELTWVPAREGAGPGNVVGYRFRPVRRGR
jgi:uncharacterized OB-fold protein